MAFGLKLEDRGVGETCVVIGGDADVRMDHITLITTPTRGVMDAGSVHMCVFVCADGGWCTLYNVAITSGWSY